MPDLLTFAKGLTSAHFAMGGVLVHDRVAEPFLDGTADFNHGMTFGGHPVGSALALKTLEIMEREGIVEQVRANEDGVRERMDALRELPFVGDVRCIGYFCAIELVRDKDTRETLLARGGAPAAQGDAVRAPARARAAVPPRRPRRADHPALAAARRGRSTCGTRWPRS